MRTGAHASASSGNQREAKIWGILAKGNFMYDRCDLVRGFKLRQSAGADSDAETIARLAAKRFGAGSTIAMAMIHKAGVSTDWASALTQGDAASEFLDMVREQEVLSRLPKLRRVRDRTRHYVSTQG